MSTIWILILFFGSGNAVTAAEFSNEKACRSAIVSAQLAGQPWKVRATCTPKEIK